MGKLLICDSVDPAAVAAMREAGITVDVRDDITPEELMTVIGEYEGMIVRSRTKVRIPLIDQASKLKVIIRGGVGLDNIDADYAESKGIAVRNTPSASSNAVVELALGCLFALVRAIPAADASMKAGRWEKKAFKGTEVEGKTLGIIGYGRIGQLLGQKAKALGMQVMAYDPYVEHEDIVALDTLIGAADFVSLHIPHTEETHHLLDATRIAAMKPGAYLVQASRGGTVDEDALYAALVEGHLAGAALDVFSEEPPKRESLLKLVALPQVIATPHIGASTQEAQARIGDELVEIAKAYLA